jgi:hypothetical protein
VRSYKITATTGYGSGATAPVTTAVNILTSTTSFTNALSAADSDVQLALNTLSFQAKPVISAKSAAFTAADNYIYTVTAGAALAIQLPTPASGLRFWIKDVGGTFNAWAITLVRASAEKIEGTAATFTLPSNPYGGWQVFSDGTDWYIL